MLDKFQFVMKAQIKYTELEEFNYVDVRQLSFDDDQIMAEVKIN